MSVTIHPEPHATDVLGWGLTCDCGQVTTSVLGGTPEAAADFVGTLDLHHGDDYCAAFTLGHVVDIPAVEVPSVNMANANADTVMDALGFSGDEVYFGECGAEDFLGRVLLALGVVPEDAGVPVTTSDDGWIVDCGRGPHYIQDRLDHLHEVAIWAVEHGRMVAWA